MKKRNQPIDLEYLKYLKDDSLLNGRDIAGIFGFANVNSVSAMIKRGQFPPHDTILHSSIHKRRNCNSWKKSTVMDAICKFNESLASGTN